MDGRTDRHTTTAITALASVAQLKIMNAAFRVELKLVRIYLIQVISQLISVV